MNARNDGLAELLVQLAGNAAALIEKAKAAQAMRAAQTVDGETVRRDRPATTAETEKGPPNGDSGGQASALQDIIVQQAMRVHALEAEVARLTAELAEARAALAAAAAAKHPATKKPAAKKSAAKRPAARAG